MRIELTQPFTRYANRLALDGQTKLNRRREMQPIGIPIVQLTLPVAEDIEAGMAVYIDPKIGAFRKFDPQNFDDINHMIYGIAMQTGSPAATQDRGITAVRLGIVAGYALEKYDFGKTISTSRTDVGRLDDNLDQNLPTNIAAIPTFPVGRVVPHFGILVDQADGSRTPTKVLSIEMSQE